MLFYLMITICFILVAMFLWILIDVAMDDNKDTMDTINCYILLFFLVFLLWNLREML